MTPFDWLALVLFFLCWLGYGPLLKVLARGSGSLNDDMLTVREAWMTAMTHREVRLLDSQLLGHSINSGSFFASSNLLLIAAVGASCSAVRRRWKGLRPSEPKVCQSCCWRPSWHWC